MPTITPADVLICAAGYLIDTISGLIPTPTCTQDAVDQLMIIFMQQALAVNDAVTAQRVLQEHTQAERVIEEERQAIAAWELLQAQVTALPTFKAEETNDIPALPQGIPQITQSEYDDYNAPPSANTKQQQEIRTRTRDFMLEFMETPGYKAPIMAQQAALRKYPRVCSPQQQNGRPPRVPPSHEISQVQRHMDQVIRDRDTSSHHNCGNHLLCPRRRDTRRQKRQ
jgi:hypothetical protein